LGWKECREAFEPDLRRIREEAFNVQVQAIEARRAAAAAAALAAAEAAVRSGGRREDAAAPVVDTTPIEVPFTPPATYSFDQFPACVQFAQKAASAVLDEMGMRLFAEWGNKVAQFAEEDVRDAADAAGTKLRFLWLLDGETGRGVAASAAFNATTADRLFYQVTAAEYFVGLDGEAGRKLVTQVRQGMRVADIWMPRPDVRGVRDTQTGLLHVAMVPVQGPDSTSVGVLVVGVRLEHLSRLAVAAQAKVVLVRRNAKEADTPLSVAGDGNDDPEEERIDQGFRDELVKRFEADLVAVAGKYGWDEEGEGRSPPRDFTYGGRTYVALVSGIINQVGPILDKTKKTAFSAGAFSYVILVDKTGAMEVLSTVTLVWIFTGIAFLLALILALVLSQGVLSPITRIEEGLLRIMNGDWTHRFDVRSAELGGISYRINQLMAALLGDEEEDGGEGLADADPKEGHYRQLYEKFKQAQGQVGQQPGSVSYDDFRVRLVENEQRIQEKNPGKQVDFDIVVSGNQITFKPILR
jgi:HAMP domain-containing protein